MAGPARAQRVDPTDRELEQEALAECYVIPTCRTCSWTGPLRTPTARFMAESDRDDHELETAHDVELVELRPSEISQLREEFERPPSVKEATAEAFRRAATEAEQSPQDATPAEIGRAIRDLAPEVPGDG